MALFPARMGADAVGLMQTIRNGQSTDWWTGLFYWLFRITSINTKFITLTAIVQVIIFSLSIIYVVQGTSFSSSVKKRAIIIFHASPIFGFFSMSISHDVTQTSGILILVGIELRLLQGRELSRFATPMFIASFLLSTTHTGFIVTFIAWFAYFARSKKYKHLFFVIIFLTVILLSNFGLTKGLNVHGNFIESSTVKYWSLLAGLKCAVQHPEAEISQEDWNILNKISSTENWKKPVSCENYDRQINALELQDKNYNLQNIEFIKLYLSVTSKNPAIVAMSHIQRARGVLPPLIFQPPSNQVSLNVEEPVGFGTNTALQSGPVFLHPSIDIEEGERNKPFIFNFLETPAQGLALIFNQASWFWGWGGLWLLVALLVLIAQESKTRIRNVILIFYGPISLNLMLIVVIPTSMPRYYMSSIVLGMLFAALFVTKGLAKRYEQLKN